MSKLPNQIADQEFYEADDDKRLLIIAKKLNEVIAYLEAKEISMFEEHEPMVEEALKHPVNQEDATDDDQIPF